MGNCFSGHRQNATVDLEPMDQKEALFQARTPLDHDFWVAHCTDLRPDKVIGYGLNPRTSKTEMLSDGESCVRLLYAFALRNFDMAPGPDTIPILSPVHRRSHWAAVGNYAYVFNARGRHFMCLGGPDGTVHYERSELGFKQSNNTL